jgi:hypothetical protein
MDEGNELNITLAGIAYLAIAYFIGLAGREMFSMTEGQRMILIIGSWFALIVLHVFVFTA